MFGGGWRKNGRVDGWVDEWGWTNGSVSRCTAKEEDGRQVAG